MKSYPIWNQVTAPDYAGSKDFGARDYYTQNVCVGASARNSFDFVSITVDKRVLDNGMVEFRFWVDDMIVKRGIYDPADKEFELTQNELVKISLFDESRKSA